MSKIYNETVSELKALRVTQLKELCKELNLSQFAKNKSVLLKRLAPVILKRAGYNFIPLPEESKPVVSKVPIKKRNKKKVKKDVVKKEDDVEESKQQDKEVEESKTEEVKKEEESKTDVVEYEEESELEESEEVNNNDSSSSSDDEN